MRPQNQPPNPRYEYGFNIPDMVDFDNPDAWEQGGGAFYNTTPGAGVDGRGGGGGHGGHGGRGHGGSAWGGYGGYGDGFVNVDPYAYPYYDGVDPNDPRRFVRVSGLDTGTGALLMMAGVWLLYEYAGKRAR